MNTVLYWLFTELPTDIWIRAMKNAWEQDPSDSILYTDVKDYYYAIILAFDYEKTPEGVSYWSYVSCKYFDKARKKLGNANR